MSVHPEGKKMFCEVQYFPWWATIPMAASAPFVLILGLTQAGTKPVPLPLALLMSLFLAGIFLLMFRMVTTVYEDRIVVKFGWLPLVRFTIPLSEIQSARAVTYKPLLEFGGWGIRFGRARKLAYSTQGNKAVEVVTTKRTILIGTALPDQLNEVVNNLLVFYRS
ncbi:MAG: hypothetical protein NZT92_00035 [Abditibacteriales bacterium]|nr:hypothetical protein [Abditibacteriales bacterium]MDW8364898.1 hypothetical protein [Abditibacteriales bacterium]